MSVLDFSVPKVPDDLSIGETRACADPECAEATGGALTAETEQDGDHRYFACAECGFEFGWERADPDAGSEGGGGSCAIGVPADVRRFASGMAEGAQRTLDRASGISRPVPLGLTISKRPGL